MFFVAFFKYFLKKFKKDSTLYAGESIRALRGFK